MNNLVASNTAVHIAIPCGYHSLRPHVEIFHSGKYTYKGGSTYFGEYSDVKNGFGESTYVPQDVDEDNEGSSEPQDKRTERFLGRFKEGRKHGDGVFFYNNGDTYAGEWKSGRKHGKGTYAFSKDKTVLDGQWVDGVFVAGTWTFPDGTYLKGRFRGNVPIGAAVWVLPNGLQVNSRYEHEEKEKQKEAAEQNEEQSVDSSEADEESSASGKKRKLQRPQFRWKLLDTTMMKTNGIGC
eukprot:GHVU01058528.1.p1 GENE.GHVU01058528.1~~GHVU01058528.1.p1  ORF type:complete len:238 (-),score=33.68 GHVU01058528.1:1055-1768(-)